MENLISNNFIIQGGEFISGSKDITFSCSYTATCIGLAFCQTGQQSANVGRIALTKHPTVTGFTVGSATSTTTAYGAFWISIGY